MDTQHPEIWLEAELPLILIAQPDPEVRRGMGEVLDDYQLCQVGDGLEALEVAREMGPDTVIADFDLP
ncbi:MAG: response regulator, partial [Akkermansiaceae bacterium]|nr:response regulator [Akkermansiaceae bacterium]